MLLWLVLVLTVLEAGAQGVAQCPSCVQCTPDARCSANDNPNTPTHLPHENDCSQFYKCSFGTRCPMRCKDGEHFSVQLQRCEYPQYACCNPTIPCLQLPGNPGNPTPLDCRPDGRCPMNDDSLKPTLLSIPGSCGSFYKCRDGDACLIPCPTGQHFSQTLQRCEYPQYACCDPTVSCLQFPGNPGNPGSTDCRPDARCPPNEDPLKPTLLSIPGSCGSFYKCRDGDACLIPCPIGEHFSQTLQRCERPEVACCDPTVTCCGTCVQRRLEELGMLLGINH